jgi:hypothetical protein
MTYQEAKAIRDCISQTRKTLQAILGAYPHLPNGLPTEATRTGIEYRRQKAILDDYWQEERQLNGIIAKTWPKEIRAEREARHVCNVA